MLYPRVPQGVPNGNPDQPDGAPSTSNDNEPGLPFSLGPTAAASAQPTPTRSPTSSSSVSTSPSTAPTAPPPAAGARHIDAGKIAAIVIPICALLSIPMIYLIYRSHQYKKAIQKRDSQNSQFQEAMLQRPTSISKGTSQEAAFRSLGAQTDQVQADQTKPHNSLGLFDFDFSPPRTPVTPALTSSSTPARLSIAHLMPGRRSSAKHVRKSSTSRSSKARSSVLLEPPLADPGPPSPMDPPPHLAPLNQIGVAHSFPSRPALQRNPSSQGTDTNHKRFGSYLGPSERTSPGQTPSSASLLPPIPSSSLAWDTSTTTVPSRAPNVSQVSGSRGQSHMTISRDMDADDGFGGTPESGRGGERYSAVSSLSDDEQYRHADHARQHSGFSPGAGQRPQQPFHHLG